MKVVLAEKPSVARDLAQVLGARSRRDGYLEGNGYQVTWAFGHLVTLKEPDDYDPSLKRWSLETLPILPEKHELKLTGDDGAQKQYRTVASLFTSAEELICATDAGREGELIFRYILEMSGCTEKPIRRLWLSSMTEEAIRTAFAALAPGQDYDNLYAAARCRSEADWIVGMNATRNFTVRYGKNGVLWSVGRVQTPVLALIATRDDEIRDFVPEPWFEVRTRYRGIFFKSRGDRFKEKPKAEELVAAIAGEPFAITDVKKKKEQDRPPQLYDLTALQRDMNVRWAMSAAGVLKDAQALYEAKLVTYPRTDSRYLTNDMRPELAATFRKLEADWPAIGKIDVEALPKDKRIFDDKKVTDHHAIIPTGRTPGGNVTPTEKKVYDAIVTRTIATFYPPCKKDVTTVDGNAGDGNAGDGKAGDGKAGDQEFRARGVRITDPGWTVLYPKKKTSDDSAEKDDDKQELPEFTVGESGPHEPEIKEGETRPPRHYNENSLLAAMETAGRLVEDDELKEALKARGLGTPATRAAIIETLLRRRYIRRDKKALTATDLGRYLVALIQDPILKSPEMTGEWEARLREIEAGELDATKFMAEIAQFTRDVIETSDQARLDHDSIGPCPKCNSAVVEGRKGFGCSKWKEGCEYVLWKDFHGQEITARQARELFQRGISLRPIRIDDAPVILALTVTGHPTHIAMPTREHQRGAPKKNGASRGKAQARTSPTAKRKAQKGATQTGATQKGATRKSAPKKKAAAKPASCPLCNNAMVERDDAYSCAAWREGCQFAIPKTIAGKKISKAMAKNLLTKGKTQVLKGFTSRSNRPFAARLKLEDGKVRFELEQDGSA